MNHSISTNVDEVNVDDINYDEADRLNAQALYDLSVKYYYGINGMPQSYVKSLFYTSKAANRNHSAAQHNMGVMNATGRGTNPNYNAALFFFKQAASQGHIAAGYNYRLIKMLGLGINYQNKSEALNKEIINLLNISVTECGCFQSNGPTRSERAILMLRFLKEFEREPGVSNALTLFHGTNLPSLKEQSSVDLNKLKSNSSKIRDEILPNKQFN